MKTIAYTALALSTLCLVSTSELAARGGRGGGGRGGGGGGSRGGGGGYSRPAPSRSPSVSRPSYQPSQRPSTSRPSARPSTGARPTPGARPSTGARPSQNQLQNFLDVPGGNRGGAAAAAGGGAAAGFLQSGQQSRGDRADGRVDNRGDRTDNRGDRTDDRGDRRDQRAEDGLRANRPDRIDDRGQRQEQRLGRRDEVRDQFHDHHPRYDFWKDNPNWARFRWNRPYRWATYAALGTLFGGGWGNEITYAYGDNVYYEGDSVYYGDEAVATTEEYAEQAQTLAESAPEVDDSADWLSLGVFAMTQDGEDSGPPPTLFVQLAVNKQGIIAGTFSNTATDKSQPIEGMVDQKSQRSAWTIVDKQFPIMETGISNLTKDTAPALVHFEDGQTQQWLLVRMEEPESEGAGN